MKFFLIKPLQATASPTTFAAFLDDKREQSVWGRDILNAFGVIQIILATKGRKWMDFVPGREFFSPVLCSDRVVRALGEGGFTGYKALSTVFYLNNGKTCEPPCPYFWLVPTGLPPRVKYSWYSGTIENRYQELVHESENVRDIHLLPNQTGENYTMKTDLDLLTLDDSDFNQFTELEPLSLGGAFRCSRRVVELAAKEKWTNVRFTSGNVLIPHLEDRWCPKGFYDDSE